MDRYFITVFIIVVPTSSRQTKITAILFLTIRGGNNYYEYSFKITKDYK